MKRFLTTVTVLILLTVVATSTQAVTIETVPVGNVGNAADIRYDPAGHGAVDYAYNIGKYEVTAGQYCEFLNAVADADPYGLYGEGMDDWTKGCQITQHGTSGNYTYDFSGGTFEVPGSTAADWENRPVNGVSWGDAARFANWMHNGQPIGTLTGDPAMDAGLTEDGAYFLNGAMSVYDLMSVSRESNWKWAITTEDEWHKAAYHKNDGDTGNYFFFPTSSDSTPSNNLDGGGNNATHATDTIGSPYWKTEVGAHENSESPYGTFDQAGNVWEWNESAFFGKNRGLRGGCWAIWGYMAASSIDRYWGVMSADPTIGFRVVSATETIPEPGDANGDGSVDVIDLGILATNYDQGSGFGWGDADFTGDGFVDVSDLGILSTNYGNGTASASVPEPGTIILLLCGLAGLLCWRRRK